MILALGVLPALLLGVVWMRHSGVPASVYMQNVVAALVGATIAFFGSRVRVSVVTAVAIVLLVATLATAGVQGVHRWIRVGPLTFHVASLVIPVVLVELDRLLRHARLAIAFAIMAIVGAILAMQPDAGQATAFAGAGVVLLAMHLKRNAVAIVAILALVGLAAASFLRSDSLAPVPYVEEIATRIGQQGIVWQVVVVIALALLIVPFVRASRGVAIAVYLTLTIAASYWGHFPVPVLGYGMSPILGYFAGWTWLRAASAVEEPHRL